MIRRTKPVLSMIWTWPVLFPTDVEKVDAVRFSLPEYSNEMSRVLAGVGNVIVGIGLT